MGIGRDEWVKFTGGPFEQVGHRIYVTLSDKYKLLMNRQAYHLIGDPKRVMLYFKPDSGVIGVSPAHDRLAIAFPVRVYNGAAVVHCSTFLKHFGIKVDGTQRFTGVDLSNEGYLKLDLSQTIQVGGFKRRRRK